MDSKLKITHYLAGKLFKLIDLGILPNKYKNFKHRKLTGNDFEKIQEALGITQNMITEVRSVYNNNHARISSLYEIEAELYKSKYPNCNNAYFPFAWEMDNSIIEHAKILEDAIYEIHSYELGFYDI